MVPGPSASPSEHPLDPPLAEQVGEPRPKSDTRQVSRQKHRESTWVTHRLLRDNHRTFPKPRRNKQAFLRPSKGFKTKLSVTLPPHQSFYGAKGGTS